MTRNVKFYSQWADPKFNAQIIAGADPCLDQSWTNTGFIDKDTYRFWSRRICALACLQSILHFYGKEVPMTYELLQDALTQKAYCLLPDGTVSGVIYAPFIEWIRTRFGLDGEPKAPCGVKEVESIVGNDHFLLWSVSSEIRNPNHKNSRQGGHMVLIYDAGPESCTFHNPSGVDPYQKSVIVDYETLDRFSSGRGIIVRRNT